MLVFVSSVTMTVTSVDVPLYGTLSVAPPDAKLV